MKRVQPGSHPAAGGATANEVHSVAVDWGVDPYARAQAGALLGQNELTLSGNSDPASIRFGADGYGDHTQSFDDYEPIQLYDWETGGSGAPLPLGQNNALPTSSGAPSGSTHSLRDLLGQAGL